MSLALYQISNEYLALAERLSDMDLDATTVADTIEASGLTDDLATKVSSIEYVARSAESHNLAIDGEITRLQALKAHRSRIAAGLREYIKSNMERCGLEKIECPLFQISIRKNPPAVDIFDLLQLPAEYMVTPEPKPPVSAPDRKAIAASIKLGIDVPGARLVQATRLVVT